MLVVATAGHVDHGKSTLVRALTGMEPDRWAEERRRGMTIDLGYAWTTLDNGQVVAFVDVPGHQRFIGNMLAGLGPSPAVMFVVAADEGWRRQSGEHLAAVDALDIRHGLLVVTRCDLADPATATEEALGHLRASSLGDVPVVHTSGTTRAGLDELRLALSRLAPAAPDPDAPVRLWVDRAFTVRGVGTVVTGTLAAGSLSVGDGLLLGERTVRIRGLQSLGADLPAVDGVARVAVNLRGLEREQVRRGDVLLTPGAWRATAALDVRLTSTGRLPEQLVLHAGSAAVPARLRPLGGDVARLSLLRVLPLRAGDRALLRDPAEQRVAAGVLVLDADPPPLRRRGAAAARAGELAVVAGSPNLVAAVSRRGFVHHRELAALGVTGGGDGDVVTAGPWYVAPAVWQGWSVGLVAAVEAHARRAPLDAGLPAATAVQALGLPDAELLADLVRAAALEQVAGRVRRPGAVPDLGAAEEGVRVVEERLAVAPFAAPEAPDLQGMGLGVRQLAAAETAGRLLRLSVDVVLLPSAPALALQVLAGLDQPFTVSAARQALGTSRRVAVPLLEHLDSRGWTVRLDGAHRRVDDSRVRALSTSP